MNILVLDPATCSGWCVLSGDCKIIEYGFFKIEQKHYVGDQLIEMIVNVKNLIEKFKPQHVVVEDYFFSKKFCQGSNLNPAYRAAIHIIVRLLGLEYTIVNPVIWKKFIVGRVKPTKDELKLYGKASAKKVIVRNALSSKYNINFPDMIQNEKGKDVKLKYDIVDAVAMGIYYIKSLGDS